MKKYFLSLAVLLVSSFSVATHVAAAGPSIALNNAYPKTNGTYDVVVKGAPGQKLGLYVNDKNPVYATANNKGWATFHKAKIADAGKLSFTQVFSGKKTVQKPINYVRYFHLTSGKVAFLPQNPSKPTITPAPAPSVSVAPPTTVEAPTPAPVTTTPAPTPEPTCTNGTYVNSAGNTVCSPEVAPSAPAGATAQCVDGTYSFSQTRSGTCSHHGGVASWL